MFGLIIEFAAIFLVLPLAYRLSPITFSPFPLLWMATLYCYLQLRKTTARPLSQLWNIEAVPKQLPGILLPFLAFVLAAWYAMWRWHPDFLFSLVRHKTWLWALIMLLYPILSVLPQTLVYRAFLMTRYKRLFSSPSALILMSGVAFSFMHIIFRNPIAVSLTFPGGLLFAWRYHRTNSLALSALEHALYGCALFTLGLGRYFYIGPVALH